MKEKNKKIKLFFKICIKLAEFDEKLKKRKAERN